jgi:C1A family cysteine protease
MSNNYNKLRTANANKKKSFFQRLNLMKAPNNIKDYKVIVMNKNTNKSIDLSKDCSPIKNQGYIGSCTSFATLGSMEYIQNKNKLNLSVLSERFTYYVTRVDIEKGDTTDSGAYIIDAIKSVVKIGTCLNNTFPYNGDYTIKPPVNAYKEALKYNVISYAKFDDYTTVDIKKLPTIINNLKANLDAGFPIIGGFVCYSNIRNSVNGIIPLPNNEVIGGHAILIVGYDDSTKMFKFKNSWGANWGEKGYGYLPYDYYLTGNMYDLWSIYTEMINSQTINIKIVNPMIDKIILQNQYADILSSVSDNINTFEMNTIKIKDYFITLINKYKNNIKLLQLILNLQTSYISLFTK